MRRAPWIRQTLPTPTPGASTPPALTPTTRPDWRSLACACSFSATGLILNVLLAFGPAGIALALFAIASSIAAIGLGFVLATVTIGR